MKYYWSIILGPATVCLYRERHAVLQIQYIRPTNFGFGDHSRSTYEDSDSIGVNSPWQALVSMHFSFGGQFCIRRCKVSWFLYLWLIVSLIYQWIYTHIVNLANDNSGTLQWHIQKNFPFFFLGIILSLLFIYISYCLSYKHGLPVYFFFHQWKAKWSWSTNKISEFQFRLEKR